MRSEVLIEGSPRPPWKLLNLMWNWKLNTPVKKAERSRGLVKTKFLNYVSLAFPVYRKTKNIYPSVMVHTCTHWNILGKLPNASAVTRIIDAKILSNYTVSLTKLCWPYSNNQKLAIFKIENERKPQDRQRWKLKQKDRRLIFFEKSSCFFLFFFA